MCCVLDCVLIIPSRDENVQEAGDGVDGMQKNVQALGQVSLHQASLNNNLNGQK